MAISIRGAVPEDHNWIVAVVNDWWRRDVAYAIPRLYLEHFFKTSYIAEVAGQRIGFLIGFVSPSLVQESYIHFVGIEPSFRGKGVASMLYQHFFDHCSSVAVIKVSATTSPNNTTSIAFHTALGFDISEPIPDYDRAGTTLVKMVKQLDDRDPA